jgi:uncharacterized protein with LGFP repeats
VGTAYDGEWWASGRVESAIRVRYRTSGGSAGELGTDVMWGPDGCGTDGGCLNQYAAGYIVYSPATGAQIVLNHVYEAWAQTGASNGPMGYPLAEWTCIPGGCFQDFQQGTVSSGGDGNSYVVRGPIEARWRALRALSGVLGEPLRSEACGLRAGGCAQPFEGGSVYWHPATGARATWGAIRSRWAAYRAENGHLGYPTTDHLCGLRGGGCAEQFQGGAVYWSPTTGAHATWGHVLTRWAAAGREAGGHGYPSAEPRCGLRNGGCSQPFQRGAIYWSAATGARSVGVLAPAIPRAWAAQGAERGSLGYPVAGEQKVRDGYAQRFQGGTLTWNSRTGQVRRS